MLSGGEVWARLARAAAPVWPQSEPNSTGADEEGSDITGLSPWWRPWSDVATGISETAAKQRSCRGGGGGGAQVSQRTRGGRRW